MLTSVGFSVLLIIQQEELMEWHLSTVTRTRIQIIEIEIIGVIFSNVLIKGKEV